jgi:hypothetical protein
MSVVTAAQMMAEDLASFYDDPLGYVLWCFPWGVPGGPLADSPGPRTWQREYLVELGKQIRARGFDGKVPVAPVLLNTTSGHGIGKSALTAMLIKFIHDTRPYSKGVVTANTGDQLKTKTWAELGKWHSMSLTKDLSEYYNTRGNMALVSKESPQTWRVDAMTCKEENSESFAGLHSATSTPFYIFDEASAIPEKIFEVAQGGLTDGEPMWFLFGNPTRNTGYFRETFGKLRHRWTSPRQIDSRTVEGTSKVLFDQWAVDYGEDSDFFRVRVKGEFPRAAVCQLIPEDIVDAAMKRVLVERDYMWQPIVLGLDVARYGDDKTVLYQRQGLAAKKIAEWRELDLMTLASLVKECRMRVKARAVFIDVGMGAGVIDRLRQLGESPIEVNFGGKATDGQAANKRAEMWLRMKKWLESGAGIPDDRDLRADLIGVEYGFDARDKILLEKKEDMKRRGLPSPDDGDALALTFAESVMAVDERAMMLGKPQHGKVQTEYALFN